MDSCELISVIITTYNREWKILNRAVNSVLNQTYPNTEIIIVNDCPENTLLRNEIETGLKDKQSSTIKYICLRKNRGACIARNTGIRKAKGQYVAFLDDDDEWLFNKLEIQHSLIAKNESVGLVYGSYYCMTDNGRKRIERQIDVTNHTFYELLAQNKVGSTSFPLIRRGCFDTCGLFNPKLQSCQDWDVWLRISKKYSFVYCKEPLGIYHLGNDRISTNMKKRIQGWKMILELYKEDYHRFPEQKVKNLEFAITECTNAGAKTAWKIFEAKLIIAKIQMIIKEKYDTIKKENI